LAFHFTFVSSNCLHFQKIIFSWDINQIGGKKRNKYMSYQNWQIIYLQHQVLASRCPKGHMIFLFLSLIS
jgi:hypothetical protein